MDIQLEHITKIFKNTAAVNDLSCTIQQGELVCLLGPSGCGKSTTLSMVAGLESPDQGEIYFGGTPMSSIGAEKRDIGMVFQNYALYPHMTVSENIQFPLKMRHIRKEERIVRVKKIAEMMQIADLLQRKPAQLSGGQQQRVAIARALVKEPQILLLDEPLSNLDARLRIELRNDIRALQQRLGITTIFVTHDQEEAMSISDRILLLRQGQLQQYSTPEQMYRAPANRFVAGFLGNPPINFLGVCYENGVLTVQADSSFQLPADKLTPSSPALQGACVAGIRPEDLLVSSKENCHFTTKIISAQPLGKEIFLKLQRGDIPMTACLSWDREYRAGEELSVTVRAIHLFPPEDVNCDETK